jgi:cyclohexadieny/prephenate dehydrogenase
MTFGTVAILGPGLIGGSLALALAERGVAERLVIYARNETSFPAIKAKLPQAHLTTDVAEAVSGADVVVLCVPIETMAALVKQFVGSLKPTALVTDVGSVKGSVDHCLAPLLNGRALWIGSHPMAGGEQTGFSAASADLFEGAAAIITPNSKTEQAAQQRAEEFWTALGARVRVMPPQTHDRIVAEISHLPHLLAAALINHLPKGPDAMLDLAGGGLRDTTRVASGSPELWTEIVEANRESIILALKTFEAKIGQLHQLIEKNDKTGLLKFLQEAHDIRSKMAETNPLFKKRS